MAFDMAHSDSAAAFYLYKYIYKGHDRVHMQVPHMQSGDEVSVYEDMHYFGACESIWRFWHYAV